MVKIIGISGLHTLQCKVCCYEFMASYQSSLVHIHSFWSSFTCLGRNSLRTLNIGNYLCNLKRSYVILPSYRLSRKGYCNLSNNAKLSLTGVANATSLNNVIIPSDILRQDAQLNLAKCEERALNANPSDGRVMLIDGTSIIYRAYYKLLGML
ncbi:hypothetical protein CFP56_002813 [Quercus suber]|uniref:5'-3' exonuclease alpha-helical arch N-terminal domain-containing protein n=1 Tax=Quercus suber TaxID=58331 RepID=A0AAW0IK61_QUESU